MKNEATIRAYRDSDESDVAALWRSVFPDAPPWNVPEEDIARKLTTQRELFLVATIKDTLIGTAMGGYDGHRGWVYYVAVLPEFRRKKIANRMMDEIERLLIEMGCPKMNLMVRTSNRDVIAFYEKLGYKIDNCVTMRKRFVP